MPIARGIQGNSFSAAYNVFFRGTQPLTAYDFFHKIFRPGAGCTWQAPVFEAIHGLSRQPCGTNAPSKQRNNA